MSNYKVNAIFSVLGVIFNTIVPIIVFPYVSRVIGVEGIGKYNFYSSALTYISIFSNFGISIYGVREIGKYAKDIIKQSTIFINLLFINLLSFSCCVAFILYIILFTVYSSDFILIILFSCTLFTNVIGAEWYFVAREKQGYLLIRNIIFKVISIISIFIFVKGPEDLISYVIITVFSVSGVSLVNVFYIYKNINLKKCFALDISKHIKPLFSIFSIDILVRFLGLGDVVLLGVLATNESVGIYSMGLKIFLLAASMMKITATTLLPRASYFIETHDVDRFQQLTARTTKLLFLIGVPITFILFVWAKPIIYLLGGNQFEQSIYVLQFLSTILLLNIFINTCVFQVLYPLRCTNSILISQIIGVALNIVCNVVFVPILSYVGTLISFAIANIAILLVMLLLEKKLMFTCFGYVEVVKYILVGIGISLIASWGMLFINIHWILAIAIVLIVYILSLILIRDSFVVGLLKYVIKWIIKK